MIPKKGNFGKLLTFSTCNEKFCTNFTPARKNLHKYYLQIHTFLPLCNTHCTPCRGFVCGDYLSVEITNLYRQQLSPYSGFQVISTDKGFHLKSGFKKK